MTRKSTPASLPTSCSAQMWGWLSAAMASASRSESQLALPVALGFSGEHLDGDRAIEARVTRTIDLTHAARAGRPENLERPESMPRLECHLN